jgi:hypothetical protein
LSASSGALLARLMFNPLGRAFLNVAYLLCGGLSEGKCSIQARA